MEAREHEPGTQLLLRPIAGVAAAGGAEGFDHRQHDTAGTGGDGWDGGCEEGFAKYEAIAESEGGAAKEADEVVGDPVSEPSLDEPACEEEGESDEPGDWVAECGECDGEWEGFGKDSSAQGGECDGAKWEWLGDDADDGGEEDGQELPGGAGDAGRGWKEPEGDGG